MKSARLLLMLAVLVGVMASLPPGGSTVASLSRPSTPEMVSGLRLVNYFPANEPHHLMWTRFRPDAVNADFARIAALNGNTVRVVLDMRAFGFPDPPVKYVRELSRVVAMAAGHNLAVALTMFDQVATCPACGAYSDLAGSRRWITSILRAIDRDDRRVAFIELQNEIGTDNPEAVRWAHELMPFVRAASGGIPVTVSVGDLAGLRRLVRVLGPDAPDFWDLHYYGEPSGAYVAFPEGQAAAAGRPLLIGETGASTSIGRQDRTSLGVPPEAEAEEAFQDYYFRTVEYAAHRAGLPPAAPWLMYDGPSRGGCMEVEACYGLFHTDGVPKPAANTIREAFAGSVATDFNGGFELEAGLYPAFWRLLNGPAGASYAIDSTTAHSGRSSLAILDPDPSPTCVRLRTVADVAPGTGHSVTAWVLRDRPGGVQSLVLNWIRHDGWTTAGTAEPAADATGWTRLSLTATTPADVTVAEFLLCDAGNPQPVHFDDVVFG